MSGGLGIPASKTDACNWLFVCNQHLISLAYDSLERSAVTVNVTKLTDKLGSPLEERDTQPTKMSQRRVKIGVIVPSSNTIMEPIINEILADITSYSPYHVTAYYTRVRVTQISNNPETASQFDLQPMLDAAALLADAKVEVIVWGGTSAGWLGLDNDRNLCNAIEAQYKIPANTATLALVELAQQLSPGNCELGLVTPYKSELNEAIRQNFASSEITVLLPEGPLGITDNHAIARVSKDQLVSMADDILLSNPDLKLISVFCTNLGGAELAKEWEWKYEKRKLVVLDSIGTTIYGALKKANVRMQGHVPGVWGELLDIKY